MSFIENGLSYVIDVCYRISGNYWIALFLFTLLVKLILFPLSLTVQRNSIRVVKMMPRLNRIQAEYYGNRDIISEETYKVYKEVHYSPFLDLLPLFIQIFLLILIAGAVRNATPLTDVPVKTGGTALLIPLLAALSAGLMCFVQDRCNPLQSQQGRMNRVLTPVLSVGLSVYLGLFAIVGLGFYWTCSNLLSALQPPLLNRLINPRRHVDYEDLAQSRKELEEAKRYHDAGAKKQANPAHKAKEKEDYRRFLKAGRKRLVFHSEKNGFYKYYQNVIEEIIRQTNIVVHYITQDPEDRVFELASGQFKPYYISEYRLIVLMMKLECAIFVTTTPELENYHLKRSYVDKKIEYIYLPHDLNSSNLTFRKEAFDHFDTIFCSGKSHKAVVREREEKYRLPEKMLVEWGSCVLDNMMREYEEIRRDADRNLQAEKKTVLIAPSWQKDNILDTCIEEILRQLGDGYHIIVRPHPQYVRHFEERIDTLAAAYATEDIEFQKDFSSNRTVYMADLLITDWSSIAYEYAFATCKPVLFIDTPMKLLNPDWQEMESPLIELELRHQVGISLPPEDLGGERVRQAAEELFSGDRFSAERIAALRDEYIYHVGESGKAGAEYIIRRLVESTSQSS